MEELDEEEADELKIMCKNLEEKASFSVLHRISPSLHEAIGVIYNRRSGKHKDQFNTPHTWTPMLVLGWFKGGEIIMDDLKLKVRYQPGDFLAIKGKEVLHSVAEWSGKLRISSLTIQYGRRLG